MYPAKFPWLKQYKERLGHGNITSVGSGVIKDDGSKLIYILGGTLFNVIFIEDLVNQIEKIKY